MLNCQRASELMSRAMDEHLPLRTRAGLRMHLMMCSICSAVERNLTLLQKTLRKQHSERGDDVDIEVLEDKVCRTLRDEADGR